MHIVVAILGALQMLWGINVAFVSETAFHEIYSAVMFGSGSICIALAVIIARMPTIAKRQSHEQPRSPAPRPKPSSGSVVKVYKGREIVRAETGVTVDGQAFAGVLSAEKHIDSLQKG